MPTTQTDPAVAAQLPETEPNPTAAVTTSPSLDEEWQRPFTIELESPTELIAALKRVAKAVPSRPAQPILASLLLRVSSHELSITAFDLAIGISETIRCTNLAADGCITIAAKVFTDMLMRLPETQKLRLESRPNFDLEIRSGKGHYTLRGESAANFPDLETEQEDFTRAELSARSVLQSIHSTTLATSGDVVNEELGGVHLTLEDFSEWAATDGHRLAVCSNLNSVTERTLETTIPVKALHLLKDAISAYSSEESLDLPVSLRVGKAIAVLCFQSTTIYCRILIPKFPQYARLIPTQFAHQAVLNLRSLIGSLERAAIMSDRHVAYIDVDPESQTLLICAKSKEYGNSEEPVPARVTGESLSLMLDIKLLLPWLKTCKAKEILIQFTGPRSPVVLRPWHDSPEEQADSRNSNLLYLVMPLTNT